jgi:hypothetical protein
MDQEDFVLAGLRALGMAVALYGEDAILRRLHAAGFEAPKSAMPRGRAGAKVSGEVRSGRVSLRRVFVRFAFESLPPEARAMPYAEATLDAVEQAYEAMFESYPELLKHHPFKAGRDQLRADMRALGIKSQRKDARRG